MKERIVSFHVDIDSPKKLLEFWGFTEINYSSLDLDNFYKVAMERAFSLFKSCGVQVTFFCVGEELKNSTKARELIREAFSEGHEIANHTYSHPFGLTKLNKTELYTEIEQCSNIVKEITGMKPVGFRAPGYDINNFILEVLEELSFQYDSSAFWTLLNPLIKYYHKIFRRRPIPEGFGDSSFKLPNAPYYPSKNNWKIRGPFREIVEIPLPRTKILQLPFYNNFHLWASKFYTNLAINLMRQPYFVYLFHLIEFVDFDDKIPKELNIHPNLKMKISEKLNTIKNTIKHFTKCYQAIRTDEFIQQYKSNSEV